jgi:hypothetical protein
MNFGAISIHAYSVHWSYPATILLPCTLHQHPSQSLVIVITFLCQLYFVSLYEQEYVVLVFLCKAYFI